MAANEPDESDAELLKRSATGDARAFKVLVGRHSDRLYRLAYSLVGNAADAEDVLQESFVGAYRGLKGFEGRSSVKTWLTKILVTQVALWRRRRADKRKRPGELSEDYGAEDGGTESTASTSVGQRIDLDAAIASLSAEHREVVVLREFEQMSYDEIAQAIGIPRGTVESRLHRARAELREKLKSYVP